ncbi:MAG: beta-propeller fold lactonase family protein, partial [Planctomycetota bacterium]
MLRSLLPLLLVVLVSQVTRSADCYVSCSKDRRMEAYEVGESGSLRSIGSFEVDCRPGCSCFDASGQHLYVGGSDPAVIQVMRRDGDGLHLVQSVTVPEKPSFLKVTPAGQFLIASYYKSGYITVHRIVGEGRLSDQPIQFLDVTPRAHCIATDPKGRFAFVPHTTASRISQYKIDPISGRLQPNEPSLLQRLPGISPRHLSFHPGGDVAFGSNESGRSISVYVLDADQGTLKVTQTLPSMPASFPGRATTSRVECHPNGKFVFIANRGHGTIAAFAFDESSQQLSFLSHTPCEKTTRGFAISPDGNVLVAAGQDSDRIVCFEIGKNGSLTRTASLACGSTPWWVTFCPTDTTKDGLPRGHDDEATARNRSRSLALGQGIMAGEPTSNGVLLQTRLTEGEQLDTQGDLPGKAGVVRFEWSTSDAFVAASLSDWISADATTDFIVRHEVTGLEPATKYHYRIHYASDLSASASTSPVGSFATLGGKETTEPATFLVGSC